MVYTGAMTARVALFVFAGLIATAAEDSPLDIRLTQLVLAGRERFRSLLTYRVDMRPRGESWHEVRLQLPGATHCRVYEHPELIYTCEFPAKTNPFVDFTQRIETALGAKWKRSDVPGKRKRSRFDSMDERKRDGWIEIAEIDGDVKFVLHPAPSER
jgi:hypothetical protein